MRSLFIAVWMLFGALTSAMAQVSVGIGISVPGVSIGINVPAYPELVLVPGYPVYYAPRLRANFFFYDGLYWIYVSDNWYVSAWYNGPWRIVVPEAVPVYVLLIPVRYYRAPPVYFRSWRRDAPPRWNEHWGHEWAERRKGWDHRDRRAAPPPAPLPTYQRRYSGDRYPREEREQHGLHSEQYRHKPRDAMVRERYPEDAMPKAPAAPRQERQVAPQQREPRHPDQDRPRSSRREQPPQEGRAERQRSERRPTEPERMMPRQERQAPGVRQEERQHGKGASQPRGRKQEEEKDRGKNDQ